MPKSDWSIIYRNIYRHLPEVKQVIYTLNTIGVPNIRILVQAVLQIFCWQGFNTISRKRGIIQSAFHRNLQNVKQVICIMYPNIIHDIVILTQSVLQLLYWQNCLTIQNAKVGKGLYLSQIFKEFWQNSIRSSTPWTQSVSQISWS